jgi:general secretion pathway protein E
MTFDVPRGPKPLPDPRGEDFAVALNTLLVARGALDELAAHRAMRAQKQSKERFDLVLTRLGLVPETTLTQALAELLEIPTAKPGDFPVPPLSLPGIKPKYLSQNRIAPLLEDGDGILVAVSDPFNVDALTSMSFKLERPLRLVLANSAEIDRYLHQQIEAPAVSRDALTFTATDGHDTGSDDVRRLEDMASEAPVIKLVNDLIVRAAEQRASDIHIEPREDGVRVRYRMDGILQIAETLPVTLAAPIASRIKVMARLDIAERRLPQDGRIKTTVRGNDLDLRVSTMPTMLGESVVLRLLDRGSVALDFGALGLAGAELGLLKSMLQEPNGLILVTGPTGSGKTTTLYTALSSLNSTERKIFTVEDPIEYQMAGINQIQVNPKIGLTFASALRSILRQDPDIILVGEIRDLETAEIAIRASLTGHLVLSTVHTNSASATITRLLDMGVEDYLLASSLKAILAQRLVRRMCPSCAKASDVTPVHQDRLAKMAGVALANGHGLAVKMAAGCPSCRGTGYSGRSAIYELMPVNATMRDAIMARSGERVIFETAQQGGMVSLTECGMRKVLAGETTVEDVLRVTRSEDAAL